MQIYLYSGGERLVGKSGVGQALRHQRQALLRTGLTPTSRWAAERDRFARFFAAAIFLPVAPDDFLCYLAGTTDMSWRRYMCILLLGKPFAIALYSMGLTAVWQYLAPLFPANL